MNDLSPADPNDVADLRGRATLATILAQELHASRTTAELPFRATIMMEPGLALTEAGVDYQLRIQCDLFAAGEAPAVQVWVAVAGRYEVEHGRELPEAAYHAFGIKDAVQDLYPYARQHVQDLAGRVGLAGFTLGSLKSGDDMLTVSLPGSPPPQAADPTT